MALLKIENLKQHFGSNKVLDGVEFEVMPGEIFGIIGSSGSGKTTILNTLTGYLVPDSGKVLLDKGNGQYVNIWNNLEYVKKKFGVAAQRPSFYEKLTVSENLDYFGSLYNLSKEARLTNIKTILELVDLEPARDLQAKNLSGGMQRRLDIACSIIHNPDVLILDEPTSDLDPILAKHIWMLIKKINKKGTTIIVASHDLNEVEYFCTKIAILYQGKLLHTGTINELKHLISRGQEVHVETYPGDYDKIAKNMKTALVTKAENRGNSLVLSTQKPDKVLEKLLDVISTLDEALLDVKITKMSLKDIFTDITKNENKGNNKEEH